MVTSSFYQTFKLLYQKDDSFIYVL